MDRELLKQCVTYHGASLFEKLRCEQTENPDFEAVAADLSKATREGGLVEQFIARKADLLFCSSWKITSRQRPEYEEEEATEPYAIMPPLELFMEVPYDERRAMLYRDLERGDVVVGRINNIREYGFFLTLLCTAGGLKRDVEDLDLSALCHIREIPTSGSHDDPLSYYQIGDFIRAGVKDIDRYQEKITVSLHQSSLVPDLDLKLGVITKEELPVHYSRSLRAANDTTETYERILSSCHGYHNPCVVDFLLERVGVSDTQPPSLMRGLQSKLFQEEDFATSIRKKQSASWALKCVRLGVDHFKNGHHVEAMNEYNKALEIDTNNVEALVARGALYANKGSIVKAISDFELALENCPDHRNAKKYLSQTLVERGRQLEEQEKLVTAEGLYRKALSLDDTNPEAQDALTKITDTIQKSIRLREEAMAKEQEQVNTTSSQTSADKLRKILKEEKRMKKKRKRSTSASSAGSSSSSSDSSSSSSSSRRKSKKKKKKKNTRPVSAIVEFPLKIAGKATRARGASKRMRTEGSRKDCSRDSFEDKRRLSSSSADSEYSRRSSLTSEYPKYPRNEAARRGSMESGRYERGNGDQASSSSTGAKQGGDKKDLPTNLLDIFNQIEQFKKEKGVRPKK
uniref:Tetratricopeptide repeat domain 14 n=1 Tax=Neogobius melanostomus TaxID=47308 RepID=A0A8C6U0J3_9GOBI